MTDAATSLPTVLSETARRMLPGGSFGRRMTGGAGKTNFDFLMRSGPKMLGHAHREVIAAVTSKLAKDATPVRRLELDSDIARALETFEMGQCHTQNGAPSLGPCMAVGQLQHNSRPYRRRRARFPLGLRARPRLQSWEANVGWSDRK